MRFALYVHHTDGEREWTYDRQSSIGRLDKGLDEAREKGWTVVEMYLRWMAENMWLFVPAQAFASQWLETFTEFPPRGGTTLGIDGVIKQLGNPPARQ